MFSSTKFENLMFHQKPKPEKIVRFLIKPIDFQFLNQISDFEFWIGFVGFCKTDPDRFLGYADFSFPECHMNYLEKTICLLGIWSPQVFLSKYVNNNFRKLKLNMRRLYPTTAENEEG
jgi:hypothetical protein